MRRPLVITLLVLSLPVWGNGPIVSQNTLPGSKVRSGSGLIHLVKMLPVVLRGPCIASVISDESGNPDCASWTRAESAGPVVDPETELVYIGGTDGLLHILPFGKLTPEFSKKNLRLPGNLVAQVVLGGDSLYLGTDNGYILSLDRKTLHENWRLLVDAEVDERLVVDGGVLYAVTGTSSIYAIEAKTGEIKWYKKRPLPSGITLRVQSRPLVYRDPAHMRPPLLVCGHSSGRLDFYDLQTGAFVRELMLGNPKEPFPAVAADPVLVDGVIIAASFNRGLFAVSPISGVQIWHVPKKGVSRVQAGGGRIYAAGSQFAIGLDPSKGVVKWEFTFMKGAPNRLIYDKGNLYFASDRDGLYMLDAKTGRLLRLEGSVLGIAGDMDLLGNWLLVVSKAGYLLTYNSEFGGVVQQRPWSMRRKESFPN